MSPLFALFQTVALAAAPAPTPTQMFSDSGWMFDSDVNTGAGTVHIYSRSIQGVPCFKATATTNVAAERMFEVVTGIPATPGWSSAGVTEAELLGRTSDSLEFYEYLDLPGWTLVNDRFWFLRGSTSVKEPGKIIFQWERLVGGGSHSARFQQVKSKHPSAVEPPINVGGWHFVGTNPVEIRYFICSDTGGSVPQAVQTMATRRTLPDTVSDVILEARRRNDQSR